MAFTATFTNPTQNYWGAGGCSATVPVSYFGIEAEFGAISVCILYIPADVMSLYRYETNDATNPLQLNSTVTLQKTTPLAEVYFRGYVIKKPLMREFEDGNMLEVTCWDNTGVLTQTLCPFGGSFTWTMESDQFRTPAAIGFEATSAYEGFGVNDTLWPDPTTAPNYWLGDAISHTATLNANIGAGATDIVLAAGTGADFAPDGWVKLVDGVQADEWVYYPTRWFNTAINRWQLGHTAGVPALPCVRGQLGTAANAWTAAAPVTNLYHKLAKRIAPDEIILYLGGVPQSVGSDFTWDATLGCLVLAAPAGAGVFTVLYSVYDEDATLDPASTAWTVQDVIDRLIFAANTDGGAGFAAGDRTFSATPLAINRYEYEPTDQQPYALPCIHDLLRALNIDEEYEFWFDHRGNKIRFDIPTLGTQTLTLQHVERIEQELDIEDVFSGVLVKYENKIPVSLLDSGRAVHQASAGSLASPDYYGWWANSMAMRKTAPDGTTVLQNNLGLQYCCDGKLDSACAGHFEPRTLPNLPLNDEFIHSYWWFDNTVGVPGIVRLTKIALSVNTFRAILGWGRGYTNPKTNYWKVRIDGATNFNNAFPTAAGYDWRRIGFIIEDEAQANGGATPEMVLEGDKITLKDVNALRIVFEYMAGQHRPGEYYYGFVHSFKAEGLGEGNYALVQTTDDANLRGNLHYIYAPASHEKLRGGVKAAFPAAGSPRCKMLDIGGGSEGGALAIGRAWLEQHLQLFQERSYVYTGELPRKPELGDVAQINEEPAAGYEYTGNIRGYTITMTSEEIITTLRVLKYDEAYIE